jgi:hypothetical protein
MMMLCCCEVNPNVTFQTRSANFKRSQIKELYELAADDIIGKILSWDYIVKISVINIKPINLLMKGVITSKAIKDV